MEKGFSPPSCPLDLSSPEVIAKGIKNAKKSTPVKVYLQGPPYLEPIEGVSIFGGGPFWILIGEYEAVQQMLYKHQDEIIHQYIEFDRRNSAIPLLNFLNLTARIEPGAIIREQVVLEKNVVIMMGAVINVGAVIGENSMIDMNCVIGARAIIGKNVHVGAGTVIAGVLEPPSKHPVVIEDGVFIGANAVVLEGVTVSRGAVIAAGSVVTQDVPPYTVAAGTPAKVIKARDAKTEDKVKLLEDLRG